MYQRILMPLDGSKQAEQVIPYALQFKSAMGCRLEFLQVIENPIADNQRPEYQAYLENALSTMQTMAEGYLEELAGAIREQGVAVSWKVQKGDPASVITQRAEEVPGTLIAISSHGRSGQTRWWLGSTADRVTHATTCPMFILRSSEERTSGPVERFTNCTVPLDGSEQAEQILPTVVACSKAFGAKVTLVQVIPETDSHFWELFPGSYEEEREQQGKEYLESFKTKLLEQGITDLDTHLLHGHPATVLTEFISSIPDNLTVMTTHGLGSAGRYRWTVGSVAQRVIGSAGDPVLVLRVSGE